MSRESVRLVELHEVRILRKGCRGENLVRVIVQAIRMDSNEQQQLANEYADDEIVFVSLDTTANTKFSFYYQGKKKRMSFLGIAAATQVLTQLYPDYVGDKQYSIETDVQIYEIDMVATEFLTKDFKIKHLTNSSNEHYWENNNKEFDGYSKENMFIEVPNTPIISSVDNSKNASLESTLVPLETMGEFFSKVIDELNNPKFRMQLKFENEQYEAIFLTFYIQDITKGFMIKLEYFTEYVGKLVLNS